MFGCQYLCAFPCYHACLQCVSACLCLAVCGRVCVRMSVRPYVCPSVCLSDIISIRGMYVFRDQHTMSMETTEFIVTLSAFLYYSHTRHPFVHPLTAATASCFLLPPIPPILYLRATL